MKILYLTNIPSPYRVAFFSELGKHCDLTVLYERKNASDRDKKWYSESENTFKSIFLKGINIGTDNSLCTGIISYLNRNRYDHIIVGVYSTCTAIIAIFYMKYKNIPFWISTDGGFIKKDSTLAYRLKRGLISSASGWFSTGITATAYLKYYGADPTKCREYPFTSVCENELLNMPLTRKDKQLFRKKLLLTEEKIIISVGQFIYRKGYDILLEAAYRLPADYGVYIIGGTPTEEYIRIKNSLKINNVHFVGFKTKKELADYYKAADIFVLPTREDIWGLVINEAMAYALPVVTTDRCIAGLEMIDEGKNGYIIPADDAEALAEAAKTAVEKQEKLSRHSLAVARKYTIEKMAMAYLNGLKNESVSRENYIYENHGKIG